MPVVSADIPTDRIRFVVAHSMDSSFVRPSSVGARCVHRRQGVRSSSEAMLDEKQSLIRDLRAQIAAANAEAAVLSTRAAYNVRCLQCAADNVQQTTCSRQRAARNMPRWTA